jgi:hypothetical protein
MPTTSAGQGSGGQTTGRARLGVQLSTVLMLGALVMQLAPAALALVEAVLASRSFQSWVASVLLVYPILLLAAIVAGTVQLVRGGRTLQSGVEVLVAAALLLLFVHRWLFQL